MKHQKLSKKLIEFLSKPEVKQLHKEAMKFQGMDKLIKKLKKIAEA
jgi:hypothetical protein